MTDINTLINLGIEIEGLLRVIADRDSAQARTLLTEKVSLFTTSIQPLLTETTPSPPLPPSTPQPSTPLNPSTPQPSTPLNPSTPQPSTPLNPSIPKPSTPKLSTPKPSTQNTLLTSFTLNDKFRFRRELFNGDIEDFDDTLALIAEMPSYDEAVDYLTNDLLWDNRNPAVEEFFEILKKNMPS